ncbi:MAG UNVERIFIED_CONTAM: hypothetical protein LVT10_08115 [Anaerolineae bacterium]|jgi:basic membrane lipoprotein Med (substrate-binding protein (PBP1-ABC) superfamily)
MKRLVLVVFIGLLSIVSVLPTMAQDSLTFGMVLVGPKTDRGWSQAHFEGAPM